MIPLAFLEFSCRLYLSAQRGIILEKTRKNKWINLCTIAGFIVVIAFCIYAVKMGLFTSEAALEQFVARCGIWGPVIFILIQLVQVVVPIIPGGITLAAGVFIFGGLQGFLYNYAGILIGSTLSFLLARRYGSAFIQSIVSHQTYEKYIGWLDRKKTFTRLFTVAILLPGAPDDLLCMIAGLSKMTFRKFMLILTLAKPPSILLYSVGVSTISEWILR
ncbi:TVP38/TMEM64 family protein [Clostridiales bacterium BX7]|uniref:TVP38/TMEM64 family membrane protein n=1 Tax=Feifania hominis TaxID=2763660 RepID=A0A926DDQ7_9FIRM|nr:TVP38/TMEM64 family protein [Feifania hominis]